MTQKPENKADTENPEADSIERTRLQFQGARVERATLNGKELEIVFSMIPRVLVKDPFGFDFEPQDECKCTITIKNPNYDFLPKAGLVNDGHIALGELCYISLFPPDLQLDCPCFLMLEQPIHDNATVGEDERTDENEVNVETETETETETFMIVGDELTVRLR